MATGLEVEPVGRIHDPVGIFFEMDTFFGEYQLVGCTVEERQSKLIL